MFGWFCFFDLFCFLIVEGKVYYSYIEKHNQRQGPLGESRVTVTLSHVRIKGGDRKEDSKELDSRRPKGTKKACKQNDSIIQIK